MSLFMSRESVREIVESEEFAAVVSHETQVRFHIRHHNSSKES